MLTVWEAIQKRRSIRPDNLIPIAVIPVGYPAGEIPPQRLRLPLEEIPVK